MSLLDALVFRPILLAIHAADIFTQSLSLATTAGLIPSGLCLSSAPSKHKIPKHVAFSLVTSDGWELGLLDRRIRRNGQQRRNLETPPYELKSRSSNKGKEKETCVQAETDEEAGSTMEKQILLSTIQEAVRWAAVRDIGEVSIWNEDGLLDEYLDSVISFLVERPPTPPASGTSSPPPYNRQRCTNLTKPDGSPTSFPTIAAQPSSSSDMQSSWIQMEPPHTQESHSSLHSHDAKEPLTDFSASRSFTVWPDIEDIVPEYHYFNTASSSSASTTPSETTGPLLRGTNARKPVTIHILSGEAGDPMIAHITKKLIAEGVPSERVSQQMMEELVQANPRLPVVERATLYNRPTTVYLGADCENVAMVLQPREVIGWSGPRGIMGYNDGKG
ncbi:hypothetical protein QFC21_007230 [Naganishia friedmannii]|uniref:Uncharacterized protein n=1 Tax=Naganishia friedmannii TaxID=89922 RepID=A0ACC2UWB0_9TREE|nr:hypothetical protein QFC21_007230 [Naganishia friedmannii]